MAWYMLCLFVLLCLAKMCLQALLTLLNCFFGFIFVFCFFHIKLSYFLVSNINRFAWSIDVCYNTYLGQPSEHILCRGDVSRNLSVKVALVSSHTTSGLPYKPRSNHNVEEALLQAASSVAGILFPSRGCLWCCLSCQAAHRLSYVVVPWSG